MLQLRGTAKVQKQLNLKPRDLSPIRVSESGLGDWVVHLATIDRRKVFLFVNEKTLLSFISYGVTKKNAKNIHDVFINGIFRYMCLEDFSAKAIDQMMQGYFDMEYTKTNSRKILGNVNNLMQTYAHYIYTEGGLEYCDLTAIIQQINRMPQRHIDWKYSVDATKAVFD